MRQYQERFPSVSSVPTITQSGGLAAVLDKIEHKQRRDHRRREFRRRVKRGAIALARSLGQRVAQWTTATRELIAHRRTA